MEEKEGFNSTPEGTEIWGIEFGRLATRIQFDSYSEAVGFAQQVFELADEEEFYPEVTVREREVDIDIERASGKGIEVAEEIESILQQMD